MRYKKSDINSTIKAALKTVTTNPKYVFATAYGFTIANSKPPGAQDYYEIMPDKSVFLKRREIICQ